MPSLVQKERSSVEITALTTLFGTSLSEVIGSRACRPNVPSSRGAVVPVHGRRLGERLQVAHLVGAVVVRGGDLDGPRDQRCQARADGDAADDDA